MKITRAENNMTLTAYSLVKVSSCDKKWTTNVESEGSELDLQPDAEIEELEAQLKEEILAFYNWKNPAFLWRAGGATLFILAVIIIVFLAFQQKRKKSSFRGSIDIKKFFNMITPRVKYFFSAISLGFVLSRFSTC